MVQQHEKHLVFAHKKAVLLWWQQRSVLVDVKNINRIYI